jgi:hypothetical protein
MMGNKSQAANTARLKRMHTTAKKIQRAQGGSYRMALKKAGAKERGKKISGTKKRRPARRKPTAMGTRITRKTVTMAKPRRRVGAVGSIAATKNKYKKQLEDQLAWSLLARESAVKVRDKKKKAKKVTDIKRELRAIGGLRKKRR